MTEKSPTKPFKCAFLGSLYYKEVPDHFHECLSSLSKQSLAIPIILVIDGAIGPSLKSIIDEFDYLDIQILKLKKNIGLAGALNAAINEFKDNYDYFIRFDTDDVNHEDRAKILVNEIKLHSPDLIFSSMTENNFVENTVKLRSLPVGEIDMKSLRFFNPIFHPASAFRVQSIVAVNGYEEQPLFEDWLLWLKLTKQKAKISKVDHPLVQFRVDREMLGRRFGWGYFRAEYHFFLKRVHYRFFPLRIDLLFLTSRFIRNLLGFAIFSMIFKRRN